jgi:hypothetical protein
VFNELEARENVQAYIIHYLVKYTHRLLCRCMLPVIAPHSASYEHEDYRVCSSHFTEALAHHCGRPMVRP